MRSRTRPACHAQVRELFEALGPAGEGEERAVDIEGLCALKMKAPPPRPLRRPAPCAAPRPGPAPPSLRA